MAGGTVARVDVLLAFMVMFSEEGEFEFADCSAFD